jgi:hypothetical protein
MTNKVKNGISYEMNGWKYVSVKGSPKERGYAYGYLVANEMKQIQEMLRFTIYEDTGREWDFFIKACKEHITPTIQKEFSEFYEEMEGFAEGCTEGGTKIDVDEVVAWNNFFTIVDSWYGTQSDDGHGGREGGGRDRCSAFIATGEYTEDGKIVLAHNNFSNFIDGQYANVVLDLKPTEGARMLIQGFIGWIWSGTDFFVTSNGIVGTETTIGGFNKYENNYPISCRMRKAMQYGKTLDDYVEILLDGNSGDYANSWMFGDINTNEIMVLELGLKYHNIKRTKNGCFIGFNAPYDPRIRNLECSNTGFDDIRRHQGARRVRLADLMEENKGKLNIELAKKIIADHYDVYLKKENPCSRTICSHYELDAREYMSDPSRPKPFQPRGALDGNVCDSTLAENMSFVLRWGCSCGTPFDKNKFCDEHRIWDMQRPYLHNRPEQPWTTFTITDNKSKSNSSKTKRTNKSNSKSKTHKQKIDGTNFQ